MKSGNIAMLLLGAVLAGMGWMVLDVSHPPRPPIGQAGSLGAALRGTKPVLVEFYADWCGPCKSVGPQVDKLAADLAGRAEVIRINVDFHPDLAREYQVEGIPCFIAFRGGRETARQAGAIPVALMRSMIGL